MIGERYFALRAQLGTALFSLQSLAAELHAPTASLKTLQQLQQGLRDPFLFVVLGDAETDKSSLLSALAGRELSELEPNPGSMTVFMYADEARNVPLPDEVTESYRPAIFLRDFTLVAAPDTVSLLMGNRKLPDVLPAADVLLFVWSARNAWSATAWEYLQRLDPPLLEKLVFVVQGADQRAPAELQALLAELEQVTSERLALRRPIFAISARETLAAKLADRSFEGTGFHRLEEFMDASVSALPGRVSGLREVSQAGQGIVHDLCARVAEGASVVEQSDARQKQLSDSLAERKEQSLRQIGGFLWTLAQTYETAQKRGEELLLGQLTLRELLGSIFRKAVWRGAFQGDIEHRLQEAVQRHVTSSLAALEADLRSVWQQFHESLQKGFPTDARVVARLPNFERAGSELAESIKTALLERDTLDEVDRHLARMFAMTAIWLRVTAAISAGACVWALILAAGTASHARTAAVVACLALLLCVALAVVRRRQIVQEFRRQMNDKRETVINGIEDQLRSAVNRFYKGLDGAFASLRSFCTAQRKLYASVLDRLAQIDGTFSRCESGLTEMRRAEHGRPPPEGKGGTPQEGEG